MTGPRQPVWSLASLAVGADVVLAVVLFGFLVVATDWASSGDVVPRPVILAILFAAPAAVGELGRRAHRRSLLLAAGLALVPESFLSFAGVTLPFLLPAALFLVAAARLRGPGRSPRSGLAGIAAGALITLLLVAAPVTVLIALTGSGCWSTATGEGCGTGLVTWPGLAAGAGCLVLAVGLAAAVAASGASRGGGAGERPYTPDHGGAAEPTRLGE